MQPRSLALIGILVALALLAGCATPGALLSDSERHERTLAEAAARSDDGEHAAAAELVESILPELPENEQADAAMQAAEYWLKAERMRNALDLTERLEGLPLSQQQRQRRALILTELLTRQGRHDQAREYLPEPVHALPVPLRVRALALRAEIRMQQGDIIPALADLGQRADYLDSGEPRDQNLRLTWRLLAAAPVNLQRVDIPRGTPGQAAAWLELGAIAQQRWRDPYRFENAVQRWRQRYPDHPANRRLLDEIIAEHRERTSYPERIALLLPLTGRFATPARAVRDGFMAAHYEHAEQTENIDLRVHDTGDFPDDVISAYRLAVQEGADFIVGPLARDALDRLMQESRLQVPTLALNRTSGDRRRVRGDIYQFSLDPEDEARQVAERASLDGHVRALALVQDGDWGQRVLDAFTRRFEELGGRVLSQDSFPADTNDFSQQITGLLNLNQSRQRHRALSTVLGQTAEFEPRRRQDADMIFIAAFPAQARQIRPQLRFHHAANLPVYATSHVFTGVLDTAGDRDMDGLVFPDMPWTLQPDEYAAIGTLRDIWGSRFDAQNRLYALGYDAYQLIPLLREGGRGFQGYFPGVTGRLYLDENDEIRRGLRWAEFHRGRPDISRPATPVPAGSLESGPAD